ncbi:MAG: DNA polymerase III subunit delta' [Proteobacteria bacterium]|nr:DNA polymerase III subunit delta' [Pseudomonadota bacterium]
MNKLYPWQTSLWQQFVELKQQQRLPHALLLTGVDGLGKNSFTQNLVKSVLCLSVTNDEQACSQCHSCQLFEAGSHPDHSEIKPEEVGKQIKIEQIRQLIEKQQLTPTISQWKTVVISPAYSMNVNANNSLLKLLEEPQPNTLFVLVTSKLEKMPITVKSRCQNLHMATPSFNQSMAWITEHSSHQNNKTTEKILQLAKGAPLAAIEMLEAQGADQYQQVEQDFNDILAGKVNPISLAATWKQFDLSQVINQLQYNIKDRIISNQMATSDNLASTATSKLYWKILDCIIDTTKLLSSQNNLNKTLIIEGFIVTIMQLTDKSNFQ